MKIGNLVILGKETSSQRPVFGKIQAELAMEYVVLPDGSTDERIIRAVLGTVASLGCEVKVTEETAAESAALTAKNSAATAFIDETEQLIELCRQKIDHVQRQITVRNKRAAIVQRIADTFKLK